MKLVLSASMALASLLLVTGCGQSGGAVRDRDSRLTVTGNSTAISSFAALQKSQTPALALSSIKALGDGQASATFALPGNMTGENLIQTTRAVLDAGLSYEVGPLRVVGIN
jgi:hypothetical protein